MIEILISPENYPLKYPCSYSRLNHEIQLIISTSNVVGQLKVMGKVVKKLLLSVILGALFSSNLAKAGGDLEDMFSTEHEAFSIRQKKSKKLETLMQTVKDIEPWLKQKFPEPKNQVYCEYLRSMDPYKKIGLEKKFMDKAYKAAQRFACEDTNRELEQAFTELLWHFGKVRQLGRLGEFIAFFEYMITPSPCKIPSPPFSYENMTFSSNFWPAWPLGYVHYWSPYLLTQTSQTEISAFIHFDVGRHKKGHRSLCGI